MNASICVIASFCVIANETSRGIGKDSTISNFSKKKQHEKYLPHELDGSHCANFQSRPSHMGVSPVKVGHVRRTFALQWQESGSDQADQIPKMLL